MDKILVKGSVVVTHKRGNEILEVHRGENLVVAAGQALIASLLTGSGTAISHMACGDDNQIPEKDDTTLVGTEHQRVAATISAAANVVSVSATFGGGLAGTLSLAEYGIFNAASGGTMLCRFATSAIQLNADQSDTIDVTWTLQFGE